MRNSALVGDNSFSKPTRQSHGAHSRLGLDRDPAPLATQLVGSLKELSLKPQVAAGTLQFALSHMCTFLVAHAAYPLDVNR